MPFSPVCSWAQGKPPMPVWMLKMTCTYGCCCRSSLGKVLRSPPQSILSLLLFTASVMVAVAKNRAVELLQQVRHAMSGLFMRSSSPSPSVVPSMS